MRIWNGAVLGVFITQIFITGYTSSPHASALVDEPGADLLQRASLIQLYASKGCYLGEYRDKTGKGKMAHCLDCQCLLHYG